MAEDEWLAATDPEPMLAFLEGKVSDRKLILFCLYWDKYHVMDRANGNPVYDRQSLDRAKAVAGAV